LHLDGANSATAASLNIKNDNGATTNTYAIFITETGTNAGNGFVFFVQSGVAWYSTNNNIPTKFGINGNQKMVLDAAGKFKIASGGFFTANAQLDVVTQAATDVGFIVQAGLSTQSADLAQFQNSSATTLFSLTSAGSLKLSPHGTGAGNTNEIRFLELAANGVHYTGFKAADSIAANVIWTLPAADGSSGQMLRTNGSGTLTWETPAGGGSTSLSDVFLLMGA